MEVEISGLGESVRASLIDVSESGFRIQYLPAHAMQALSLGKVIAVRGVMSSGPFAVRGVVQRMEPETGEVGVRFDGPETSAVRELLHSALAGAARS